ncbi:hypothetical protein [Blastococcus sp. CT_GayMR16]|uniref:hypothetical protein n=1 Tax=Blastococcus sp. CT_GayMR16 TaxID=2559607 RepID=UPI0010747303|nr:hypothetical protein [Blastococcus sp. CT_GayMR16]TFV91143.1 hypothetical protein E4P38_00590 [Blastococcus sp. CT_GayMR16]
MARGLRLAAAVIPALVIIGSCSDKDQKPDPATAAAAPSSSAPHATERPERSAAPSRQAPTATTAPTTAPGPAPLDVVPIAYAGDVADEPTMPPLPPVPPPGMPAATVDVRGGWTGGFLLDGSDPRVGVSCNAQPEPRAGIEVAGLNYMATSKAGVGEYGLPDGGWSLRVTRTGSIDNPAGIGVSIAAVDADGEAVEIAGFGTEAEPNIAAAGATDNSAVAFSFVSVAVPRDFSLYEKVTWVTVTGTVVCPGPLPELSSLRDDG